MRCWRTRPPWWRTSLTAVLPASFSSHLLGRGQTSPDAWEQPQTAGCSRRCLGEYFKLSCFAFACEKNVTIGSLASLPFMGKKGVGNGLGSAVVAVDRGGTAEAVDSTKIRFPFPLIVKTPPGGLNSSSNRAGGRQVWWRRLRWRRWRTCWSAAPSAYTSGRPTRSSRRSAASPARRPSWCICPTPSSTVR